MNGSVLADASTDMLTLVTIAAFAWAVWLIHAMRTKP